MLFQLRDLVFTILEETILKCFLAIHIFGRCYIFGLYSKCLNKTIWERFFFLEGSHVHCTYIRAFKKWIVVCQKEKDKRIPSWHITVLSTWCGTFAVGFLCQLVLVQSLNWSSGVAVKIIPGNQLLYSWRLSLLCLLCFRVAPHLDIYQKGL